MGHKKGKEMLKNYYLQLFAEDGNDDGDTNTNVNGGGADNEPNNEPMSFDDFMKVKENQAELDRRIQKATQTAVKNAEAKWKALTDDKVSEAEKLAHMSREEKALYKASQLEKELEELKRNNVRTQMASEARKMLRDEEISIPDELLSNLISDNAEKTKEAVDGFAKMYKEAVQAGVKEALRGGAPKKGSGSYTITKEQIFAVKDPAERQRLIAENIELFK